MNLKVKIFEILSTEILDVVIRNCQTNDIKDRVQELAKRIAAALEDDETVAAVLRQVKIYGKEL